MGVHKTILKKLLKTFSPGARKARMDMFVKLINPKPGQRVLDLGGTTKLWRYVDVPLHITVLNLEAQKIDETKYGDHTFIIARGDATELSNFADYSFDVVFSNSCIEHVGPDNKQAAFAKESQRLAPSFYIQTPARNFPIEAHTGLPFWWFYPVAVRSRIISKWGISRPNYGNFIGGTRVLSLAKLKELFPDSNIYKERVAGLVKSHTMWRSV